MIRASALIVTALMTAGTAWAQSEYWDLAPLRLGLELRMIDADIQDVHLAVDRSVPLDFFLPNVSPGSRIDVLGAAVGVRHDDGDFVLRWRVAPLDLDLTRPPWTGGVTLLRYDRTQTREVVADWFAVHAGPAARIRMGGMSVEPAVVLRGSLATRRTGERVFDGPDTDASTGFAGTAAVRLAVVAPGRSLLHVTAGIEKLWGGADTDFRSVDATLVLTDGPVWGFALKFAAQEIRLPANHGAAGDHVESTYPFGFTVRFTPGSAGARTF